MFGIQKLHTGKIKTTFKQGEKKATCNSLEYNLQIKLLN